MKMIIVLQMYFKTYYLVIPLKTFQSGSSKKSFRSSDEKMHHVLMLRQSQPSHRRMT